MLYLIALVLTRMTGSFLLHLKISGRVPSGGVILCSNHLSNIDPPIIASAAFKRLYFMAKKELFARPIPSYLLRKLNAFPVNRKFFDRAAFRKAVGIVNSGRNLLIFPEGTRNKTGDNKIKKIHRAVSYIIYHTKKPVVPVFVKGTNKWKKLSGFFVKFGHPLDFPERKLNYTRETAEKICTRLKDGMEKISY